MHYTASRRWVKNWKMRSDKSYEVSDDGKTLTVEIYDYVHDQAGNKIDAEDVAWSYNTYLATGNANTVCKYLDSAEATDATHVVFTHERR